MNIDLSRTLCALVVMASFSGCGGDDSGGGGSDTDTDADTDSDSDTDTDTETDTDLAALITGVWESPDTVPIYMRFDAEGVAAVAQSIAEIDTAPFGVADYTVVGDLLTFTQTAGVCSTVEEEIVGTYTIGIAAGELTFTVMEDVCAQRNVIDGQTWTSVD